MNEFLTTFWNEILLTVLIPMIGYFGKQLVDALKNFIDGKLTYLAEQNYLTVEETARARIYEAIDTAAELVLASIASLKDLNTAPGEDALKKGLEHVKESMAESLEVIKTTDDVLMRVIKKNVVEKLRAVTSGLKK